MKQLTKAQQKKSKRNMDLKAKSLGFDDLDSDAMVYYNPEITDVIRKQHHWKIIEELHPLGWVGPQQMCFDFSATDPNKLALKIFQEGIKVGKIIKERDLQLMLGIKR